MGLSNLEQLYRQVILDHAQHPHHHGLREDDNGTRVTVHNPSCGDTLTFEFVETDGIITDARFEGVGCTISQASASMMCDVIIGKTIEEAKFLAQEFSLMVQGELGDPNDLGDAAILSGVAKFPARIKCATLSWKAIEEYKPKGPVIDEREGETDE